MKVSNHALIRRLSLRTLTVNRTRNLIAILAIALTTLMFTSLFTIALSVNQGIQENSFRQVGGFAQGGFKYLTQEQFETLRDHPLIREWGVRRFLGMPQEEPFNKSHVEIGYSDAKEAHWTYCDPVEGRLPREGTDEAATDTTILSLLGVEPELGAQFTVTFTVDGHQTTQTFTLCGWWEYDPAIVANHILIPESRVDAVLEEVGVTPPGSDGMTGSWNLDVMLKNGSRSIEADLDQILADNGYQGESPSAGENYIRTGVNWAYTGAQFSQMDPITLLILVGILLLILLTGYLIIYNVFQISVAGDIRFYGLLKTIGTTPRQLRRIIRYQALLLALGGIPGGLVLGWLAGRALVPLVVSILNGVSVTVSISPLLFLGAAAFSLATVLISCRRPGRMAGKVSPMEAVRYTEGKVTHSRTRRNRKLSLVSMALANLTRSPGKTLITILSLSLAVVLLTFTVTLAGSFDMDKYLSNFVATDFILGDAGQFQTTGEKFSAERALPQEALQAVDAQGGITGSGRIYGRVSPVQEFVTEEYFRQLWGQWNTPEQLDSLVANTQRTEQGLAATAELYGMDPFVLDQLNLLEGDLTPLYQEGNYIAAVYTLDDYGELEPESHWAKVGDQVTLRYVEELEYYNPQTGEVYQDLDQVPVDAPCSSLAVKYRDVVYTVAALVDIPSALSYRYYGDDAFVLGSDTFIRDTGTNCVMYYAFDTDPDATGAMETFLQDYTQNQDPSLDFESKDTYSQQFRDAQNLFLLLGGALSFIVGLVGALNFFNAILTGIAARRRELAVLQAIGMTRQQLVTMLVTEGLLYTLGGIGLALLLVVGTAPLLASALPRAIWFLTYRFTLWPVALMLPIFALLGAAIPAIRSRGLRRLSVVERLREE